MSTEKSDALRLWLLWKQVADSVRLAVVQEVSAGSDASDAELTVLVHLRESGGVMRQNALAAVMGWDRTRLSHLLTRMEGRDHLARTRVRNGVEVELRAPGADLLTQLQPALDRAARIHLSDRLEPADRERLELILQRLR